MILLYCLPNLIKPNTDEQDSNDNLEFLLDKELVWIRKYCLDLISSGLEIKIIYLLNPHNLEIKINVLQNHGKMFDNDQKEIIRKDFREIKLVNKQIWKKIIKSSHEDKILFYSDAIDKSIAIMLKDIPSNNLEIRIGELKIIADDVTNFLEIIIGIPEIDPGKSEKVGYNPNQSPLDIFRSKKDPPLSFDNGFILYLKSPYNKLTEFVINELLNNDRPFLIERKEDIYQFSDRFNSVVIKNFNSYDPQELYSILKILVPTEADNKKIIICGNSDKVIPFIKEKANYYFISLDKCKRNKGLIKFLCYYLGRRYNNKRYHKADESFFRNILIGDHKFYYLIEALDNIEIKKLDDFYNPIIMFKLFQMIKKINQEKEISKASISINSIPTKCFWIFKGDSWDISFNYTKPISVRDVAGFFWLGLLMQNANRELNMAEMREKYTRGYLNPVTSDLQWLRNNIKDAITIIKEKEKQLGYENHLSDFLQKSYEDSNLSDTKGTARWVFNKDHKCNWEIIFIPPQYYVKESGKRGTTAKKNKKKDKS